jgi:hypothetical protein
MPVACIDETAGIERNSILVKPSLKSTKIAKHEEVKLITV